MRDHLNSLIGFCRSIAATSVTAQREIRCHAINIHLFPRCFLTNQVTRDTHSHMTFVMMEYRILSSLRFSIQMCKQKGRSPAEGNACNNSKQRQKCAVYLSDVRVLVCVGFPSHWRTLVFSARTQLWQRQHGPIRRAADKQTAAGRSLTLGSFPSLRPTFSSCRLATHFPLTRLTWLLGNRHNTTARLSTERAPVVSIKEWECVRIYTLNLCWERCHE